MIHVIKSDNKTAFGRWLNANRIKNNISCAEIAERLHCSRQTIQYHESGKVKPSYVFCLGYALIFEVNAEDIWTIVNCD